MFVLLHAIYQVHIVMCTTTRKFESVCYKVSITYVWLYKWLCSCNEFLSVSSTPISRLCGFRNKHHNIVTGYVSWKGNNILLSSPYDCTNNCIWDWTWKQDTSLMKRTMWPNCRLEIYHNVEWRFGRTIMQSWFNV